MKAKKLTPALLRKMIISEKRKFLKETSDPIAAGVENLDKVEAKEVDADDLSNTLEKDIDHL